MKIKNIVYGMCLITGFMLIVGTIGAIDCDTIGFTTGIIQSAIGLLLSVFGSVMLKINGCEIFN